MNLVFIFLAAAADVQSRFKYIRDACVKAHMLIQEHKKVPSSKEQYYKACTFLHPYIKHSYSTNDDHPEGSEASNFSRSNTPVSLASKEFGDENSAQCSRQDDIQNDIDMEELAENQNEYNRLVADVLASTQASYPAAKKRKTVERSQLDFAKKSVQNKDNQNDENHLQVLTDRMAQLMQQNNSLMKAKARARLISKCIEELPMAKQVACIPKVLEILKKYEKKN